MIGAILALAWFKFSRDTFLWLAAALGILSTPCVVIPSSWFRLRVFHPAGWKVDSTGKLVAYAVVWTLLAFRGAAWIVALSPPWVGRTGARAPEWRGRVRAGLQEAVE